MRTREASLSDAMILEMNACACGTASAITRLVLTCRGYEIGALLARQTAGSAVVSEVRPRRAMVRGAHRFGRDPACLTPPGVLGRFAEPCAPGNCGGVEP